jgi:hypothetical protein
MVFVMVAITVFFLADQIMRLVVTSFSVRQLRPNEPAATTRWYIVQAIPISSGKWPIDWEQSKQRHLDQFEEIMESD